MPFSPRRSSWPAATNEDIVAVAGQKLVVACAAVHEIVAGGADEGVVAVAAD